MQSTLMRTAMRAEISRDSRTHHGGLAGRYFQFDTNSGPLIRLNRMENNDINGLVVRGEQMNTAGDLGRQRYRSCSRG